MKNLILLSLGLFAVQAFSAVETVDAACAILMGDLDPATKRADLSLEEKQARFEAAVFLKEFGTGSKLPDGGRRFAIAEEHQAGLIEAFKADYTAAAAPGAKASFAAPGNFGHMGDHFDYENRLGQKIQSATGVDRDAVKLAMAAHDIGKGFMDAAIADYVKLKGESSEAAKGINPFLHNYILSHEEHSIARIPGVIAKYLESQRIDTASAAGEKMVRDYSLQVIEGIRQHNGVDVTGDLKAKYPSLTDEELETVRKGWWAVNYENYAETMGLPKRKYGGETEPVAEVVNYYDRATLTADGALEKLTAQNLGKMSVGVPWIAESMITAAQDNGPLLKAQADKVRKLIKAGDVNGQREFNEVHAEVTMSNTKLESLGKTLVRMNDKQTLLRLGVPRDQLPWEGSTKPAIGEKVFVYVRASQPGDEPNIPSVQAQFSKSLDGWSRVDATDPANPKTETWVAGRWVSQPSTGNAAIQFAGLVRKAKLWGNAQ